MFRNTLSLLNTYSPSGAHEFTSGFVRLVLFILQCTVQCFVHQCFFFWGPFSLCILAFSLHALLQFTDYAYLIDNFSNRQTHDYHSCFILIQKYNYCFMVDIYNSHVISIHYIVFIVLLYVCQSYLPCLLFYDSYL